MSKRKRLPDSKGYFGEFGGRYVIETLLPALNQLEKEYACAKSDPAFKKELNSLLKNYVGRATPLYYAKSLTEHLGGAKIYLKREDLNHTGAHKINNTIGQALLAIRMGKKRIIAETGAGQHGVATATAAALFNLECDIYMGVDDIERQKLNVYRMKLMGSKVIPVTSGSRTLKDATNEALRDWIGSVDGTHYIIGSVVGPHPFPMIVRDFQSVIGKEAKKQILVAEKRLPDMLIACVGGGSNSIGLFHPFYNDTKVKMVGVEAGGTGKGVGKHGATITYGDKGILHGNLSYLIQDKNGQIVDTHSISAGLDYPGVGPEHSFFAKTGRAVYKVILDKEALKAFELLNKLEGIMPALESSHAIAQVMKEAPKMNKNKIIVVCLSGRGDKDVTQVLDMVGKDK